MSRVFITDYITDPKIEKSILKDEVSTIDKENAEILLVWHKENYFQGLLNRNTENGFYVLATQKMSFRDLQHGKWMLGGSCIKNVSKEMI